MSERRIVILGLCLAAAVSAGAQTTPAGSAPSTTPDPASPSKDEAPVTEAVVETVEGSFVIRLLDQTAPKHVAHFVKTARAGGYDGTAFHRIIAGGLIQGGDPRSKDPAKAALYGTGGLGLLKAEFSDRPFKRGAVGAARKPSSKDSGGSQFFVCLVDQPSLAGQYTLFGEVSEGLDVADKVGATPVAGDKPIRRVEIRKVTIRQASRAPAP